MSSTETKSGRITVPHMSAMDWLKTVFDAKQHGSRVNVPGSYTHLPCGCQRKGRDEIRIGDQVESWHVVRRGNELFHNDCNKKIADL